MQSIKTKSDNISKNIIKHIRWRYLLITYLLLATCFNINLSFASDHKLIAITEIVEHSSLSQAKLGIIDSLKNEGFIEGKNLKIVNKNAQGALANAVLIAKQFIQMQPDAIVPISTLSTQTVLKEIANTNIPVVFSSVTDPVTAGILPSLDSIRENITGAIDYPLIKEEIELIKAYLPDIKTIGFLYSAGEINSVKTIELIKKLLEEIGIKYIESQISSSHQIGQAMSALVGKVDAVYIPSDNVVFSAMPKLVQISRKYKLPVFSSDPDSVKSGVLACIGYTQYEIGKTAGKLLARILKGERNLMIEKPAQAQIFINEKTARILGLEVLDNIMGIKANIVGKE